MARRAISEHDQVYAAYLYAHQGKTQAEIAAELKVSPAVISRVLDRVRGAYYEESRKFLKGNVSSELQAELENRLLANKVGKALNRLSEFALGRPGPTVRVFRVGAEPEREGEPESSPTSLEKFTRMAAPSVWELLSRARLCGVTWGGTLATLVRTSKTLATRPSSLTEFIPLAGEPLGFAATASSSSILADELQQLFRDDKSHARSLTMLPALIPSEFSRDERRVIEKLIGRLTDYRIIFLGGPKGEEPLADDVDGIITSVGPNPLGFVGGSLLDEKERPFFVGDLGGILLPKNQVGPAKVAELKAFMDDFEERWKGLRQKHVRKCAERAAAKDAKPSQIGVVVVCMGASRAAAIFECVKNGLVSHLFIDESLEKALENECESRSKL
ncbi:MAG: hypothetical protein WBW33_25200 [Bryobacteraceae bacterium]